MESNIKTIENNPRVIVILPAYNEESTISSVVKETYESIVKAGFKSVELVIVDDGSIDQTEGEVLKISDLLPLTLLKHKSKCGLGVALSTGMAFALENSRSEDVVLTTEADGTQPANKLAELALAISSGSEFVVATPLKEKGSFINVPLHRRILSHGANLLYRVLFPMKGLHDYTNLTRGYRAGLLQDAMHFYGPKGFIDKCGFEAVPDIAIKLRRFNPKILELGISIDFSKMKRDSTIHIWKTLFQSLLLCVKHLVGGTLRFNR